MIWAIRLISFVYRYLPQVYASWYSMGSGSLSYLRLLLSIFGGVGATVQKAMMHEDVSTWFPPLVGHSLEIVIVLIQAVVCVYKSVLADHYIMPLVSIEQSFRFAIQIHLEKTIFQIRCYP